MISHPKKEITTINQAKDFFKSFINDLEVDKLRFGLKRPNIFEILKISSAEIRHSNFLSWLLDPNAGHGLGPIFLQKILREIFSDEKSISYNEFYVDDINYNKIEIHREWKHYSSNLKNSLDILIKHPDFIIAIENKINSVDNDDQLKKYKEMIEECFPEHKNKCLYVYLTLEGIAPNDKKAGEHYIMLSYRKIIDFLKSMIEIYTEGISFTVKQYINDYITILSREIMDEEELTGYAKSIYKQHKHLLDFVYKYGAASNFKEAYEKFKNEKLKKKDQNIKELFSSENIFSFIPLKVEMAVKQLVGSTLIKLNTYGKEYPIHFWFENSKGEDSVRFIIEIGPFIEQIQREKFKILISKGTSLKLTDKKSSTSFTRIYSKKIIIQDRETDQYLNAMNALYDDAPVQTLISELSEINFSEIISV